MTNPAIDAEAVEMTPEQAVKVFLGLPHEEQVQRMDILLESSHRAHACFMRDHAGAEAFSRNHSCKKAGKRRGPSFKSYTAEASDD